MNIAKRIGFTPPPYTKENKHIEPTNEFTIVFDTEEEAQQIIMLLELLMLRSRNEARAAIVRACEHEWVDADNEVVENAKICLKCHDIREK